MIVLTHGIQCVSLLLHITGMGQTMLPAASDRPALDAPHFPSRMHAFIWRNWECFDPQRLAEVIGATRDQVLAVAGSMGLPDWPHMNHDQFRRNYICVIRRNWHLLNYDQLLKLLDWTPEQLAYTLREDDFLWHKLGAFKPACPLIGYQEPTPESRSRCAQIKAVVERTVQGLPPPVARFSFVDEMSVRRPGAAYNAPPVADSAEKPLRFLYSYFAVYGDPLLNPDLDPYPDGLLQRLADVGVNGVWMHVVLRDLAPSHDFPEFGKDHETRLANLKKLVERAGRFGVRIYLYMNEPRAMPGSFFASRPDLQGVPEGDFTAMCTSAEPVRRWLTESLAHVFRAVPDLGGVFTITASENLTNCCSHYGQAKCPRCSKRTLPEVIAEVNAAIAEGVWRGSPKAKVITWDWGWPNEAAPDIIRLLPKGVMPMSVSEWDQPFTRGGIASKVAEYSLSVVGPGPRATKHWELAKARGLKAVARISPNCTWELSAVPYLPVMNLVAQHCVKLRAAGVDGLMLSWTLGGYPSPNLSLVQRIFDGPANMTADDALRQVAIDRYGSVIAPAVLKAWTEFSQAFTEFPYDGALLYQGPQQVGPANLLYANPTHLQSTMVGFPYDDLSGWRGVYPPDVLASQFEKVSLGWKQGLAKLDEAVAAMSASSPSDASTLLESDRRVARAAGLHLTSTANQILFYIARNARRLPTNITTSPAADDRMHTIINNEARLARELLELTMQDSRIGYEASNHYYYLPTDLLEKIVACDTLTAKDR